MKASPSPYRDLPIGVIELDASGVIERWNLKAGELLDWPDWRAEVPMPSTFAERVPSSVLEVRDDRPSKVEVTIKRRGGPRVSVVVSHAPVHDERGRRTGTIVSLEDRSEERIQEQTLRQAERLEAMERLAGSVAHDFNNLLTVILGYGQMLLRTVPEGDERRESIEAIAKAGRRATELTSKLSMVGRRRVVQPVVLDVHARIEALESVLRGVAGDDVDLRLVTNDESAYVRLDPQELELVVTNLVINSVEAMPEGGRVVIDCRPLVLVDGSATGLLPGSYVVITVADTGIGMSAHTREHCFDPFFTTKTTRQGAGVGLAAVYGVATEAGGGVEVTSQHGRGCSVRVYLPMVHESVVGADRRAPKATEPIDDAERQQCLRVLLVDDEPLVRAMLSAVLADRGHDVVEAGSAEDALDEWRRSVKPFDVVVSDLVMPGLHGDELARHLLEDHAWLQVLLISGYVERAATLDPERVSFLAKPFALDEFADRVEALVPARRQAV